MLSRTLPTVLLCLFLASLTAGTAEEVRSGEVLYRQQCADCHGLRGEGVEGEYDEPLYGDRSIEKLTSLIHRTMPEDEPELCVDDDAERVARYIYDAFYSKEARARNQPVRVELARLTAEQFEQSAADLVAAFRYQPKLGEERGLEADYYEGRRPNRDKRKIERIDPEVRFQFGEGSPDSEKIPAEAFSIEWKGALLVETTGVYEFCVATENGFKLHLNSDADKAFIDGWVSSGAYGEQRATMKLLGGRAYPIRLEFFKFKDKSASIELRWKPPGGVEEVIPQSALAPVRVAPVMVVNTSFPADDRSMGYVRGTAVSKAWHEATTSAAVEVANHVTQNLRRLAKADPKDPEAYREAVEPFCERWVERAFRRPLTDQEKQFFVEQWFAEEKELELEATVKRVVILSLKSPHFLYPEALAASDDESAHTVLARLALALRDSLPDENMWRVAREGRLQAASERTLRPLVKGWVDHPLTRLKIRGFFDHWLHLDEEHDLSKDPERYPDYDQQVMADFRHSLNLFIDDVVWSEASDYRQLLLSDRLYLNAGLADFLGHGSFKGRAFRPVAFDPKTRAGVLTHPYMLARFAYHASTSPIHRGVFVTRSVLGRTLKPPPEAVQFEESRFDPSLTMREKVTELTKADSCMTCHAMINPMGFSLEHFDAVGRYRFSDEKRAINARSEFQTHAGESIAIEGARDVARHAANSPLAQRAFIQHLFEHLIKQPVNAYGADTLDRLHKVFMEKQFSVRELIVEIVVLAALHEPKETEVTGLNQSTDHEHDDDDGNA